MIFKTISVSVLGVIACASLSIGQTFPPASGGGSGSGSTTAISPVATPSAPAITQAGTPGSTTYGYQVAARNQVGHSAAAAEAQTTTGVSTLSGTNYNVVTTAAVTGSTSCDVWRTTGGDSQGWIANVPCGTALHDTGLIGQYETPYSFNNSQGSYVANNLATDSLTIGAPFAIASSPYNATLSDDDRFALQINKSITHVQGYQAGGIVQYVDVSPSPGDNNYTADGMAITLRDFGTEHLGEMIGNYSLSEAHGPVDDVIGADFGAHVYDPTATYLHVAAAEFSTVIQGGAVTNAWTQRNLTPQNNGSQTVANGYGLRVEGGGNAGTITTLRGIQIEDLTGEHATTTWGLYVAGPSQNSKIEGDLELGTLHVALHTPASSSEACTVGQIADDVNFHYACTATNVWKRVALSSF